MGWWGKPVVATRKPRAKRFVECFMESFRIVDFLSLLLLWHIATRSGFMIAQPRSYESVRLLLSALPPII